MNLSSSTHSHGSSASQNLNHEKAAVNTPFPKSPFGCVQ